MLIANPNYNATLAYLMQNTDIAKNLLSTILHAKFVTLKLERQETIYTTDDGLQMSKIDFKATLQPVLTYTGAYKPIVERLVRHLNQELLNDKKLLYALLTEQEMEEEWKRAQNAEKEVEDNKESLPETSSRL